MATFQYNMTHRCNLNCPFCYSYKNNDTMDDEIIRLATDFVINRINLRPLDETHLVSFSGGEVFLGKYKNIPSIIGQIKYACPDRKIEFSIQSNLTTKLIEDYDECKEVVNAVDFVGTSYDIGTGRFSNAADFGNFINNIKYLQKINKSTELIVCITKQLIEARPYPKQFLLSLVCNGFNKIELERLSKPLEKRPAYDNWEVRAKNQDIRDWLYLAYVGYKELQKDYPQLSIETFNCMEDAVKGIHRYEYGRNCQKDIYTILPNGKVGQCFINIDKPFYDLRTKELNINNYNEVCAREDNVSQQCKNCKYYEYCRGGCCCMEWDDTGCPTPFKIFDLITERK